LSHARIMLNNSSFKLSSVGLLLKDGNVKLKDSVNKNDKAGINTTQLMIDTAKADRETNQWAG